MRGAPEYRSASTSPGRRNGKPLFWSGQPS